MEPLIIVAQMQQWDYRTYLVISFMVIVAAILAMATIAYIAARNESRES